MFIQKLKTNSRLPLLIIAGAFSLLLLFYLALGVHEKSAPQGQVASNPPPGLPVRLTIPSISVNASIQLLGVVPSGEMEVPNNSIDVGWFKRGPRPGQKGSAVIVGHFDGENGESGVFTDLYKLKEGDKLYIEDDKGIITPFVVRENRTYDPGYAEEVFSSNDSAHLNLVTCKGNWDENTNSYSKRLVVFSDMTQ